MAYTKAHDPWVDGIGGGTRIDAVDLNTMEQGIADAHTAPGLLGRYAGVDAKTGTAYTPVLTDEGKLITLSNASPITVTLPQNSVLAFPVGGSIDFVGIGTGLVTFAAGSGATVNGTPTLVTRAQWSTVTVIKRATNTWLVVGDLGTP